MTIRDLADRLYAYDQDHPEQTDMELYSVLLDIAMTKRNIKVNESMGQLQIINGNFSA